MNKKEIHVLQIIPGFPTGGAEQVVLSYLRYFKDNEDIKFSCISLSPSKNRLYEKQIVEEDLPVSFYPNEKSENKIKLRLSQIKYIRNYVKKYKPDIVHIHLSILWVVTVALLGMKVRVFHTLHNDPRELTKGKAILVSKICYNLGKVRPIALNQKYKKIADDLYGTNCEVLGNGIKLEEFKYSKSESRMRMGLSDDCFVVGHVGRFHRQKNHNKIIDVFKYVHIKKPDSKLVLIGDGELESTIKKKVHSYGLEDAVMFLGNRSDVPRIMAALDVFLFPSLYEGLGIVLVEAQAASVKCVISDEVPRETVVTDKVYSLQLDDFDEMWAEAVVDDIDNAKVKSTYTLDCYSIEFICNKLLEIYLR